MSDLPRARAAAPTEHLGRAGASAPAKPLLGQAGPAVAAERARREGAVPAARSQVRAGDAAAPPAARTVHVVDVDDDRGETVRPPAERPLPGLGDAVQAAREGAGLSVEALSARTKIRGAVLRDLEAGSTVRSGGAAYARGHLRAIARATGTDPAVLLEAHDRTLGAVPPPPLPGAAQARPEVQAPLGALRLPPPARERRGPRWGVALAGAATVLSVLMIAGGLADDRPGTQETGERGAALEVPQEPVAAPVPPPATAPVVALRLEVTGDASWVDVLTEGGQTLFRGVLPAGSEREFTDPSPLSLTVGNAGAVTVACGGTDVPAGRRGQVRRYTCAPDGLTPA